MSAPLPTKFGLGTYRGPCSDEADALLRATIQAALAAGIRHFDTAINYRSQRAEHVLGASLDDAIALGLIRREECHVSSKAGFVPWDRSPPCDEDAYYKSVVLDSGLAGPEELAPGGHCLAPAYLEWSINRTLRNLGLQHLDCVYVHNPEAQLAICSQDALYRKLQAAFSVLESFVEKGSVRAYGVSTWSAFRVPPGHAEHLSLQRIVEAASAAKPDHRFRFVQAPLNLVMPEAAASRFQSCPGGAGSLLSEAKRLGLRFVASAPLAGGDLRDRARLALNFVRSLPGVDCILLGAKAPDDVALPASLLNEPGLTGRQLMQALEQLAGNDGI